MNAILPVLKERLADGGILSGYTLATEPGAGKMHHEQEYEFCSKEDLMSVLSPHFTCVKIFETIYPTRHNLYFYASDTPPLPFDPDWTSCIGK